MSAETELLANVCLLFNENIGQQSLLDMKEYMHEYKHIIKQRENNRQAFFHISPQRNYRKNLVEYMKQTACDKKLTQISLQLAVYLLDIFMDNHYIAPEKLSLMCNTCLLLAAKLEETWGNIPKIQDLVDRVQKSHTVNDVKIMEIIILKFFKWTVMYPVPAHYTHYYMQVALNFDDIKHMNETPRTVIFQLHEMMRVYMHKVIEDVHYMQYYSPSLLASGIISAARSRIGLSTWTKQLELLTGYSEENITEVKEVLFQTNPLICSSCLFIPITIPYIAN